MDPKLTEDKIKPFLLVKYFAYTGLVVIFLVTLILSVFNTHWVKSMQRKKSEDIAHAMLYLASDASRFVTGQVLRPNGGVAML